MVGRIIVLEKNSGRKKTKNQKTKLWKLTILPYMAKGSLQVRWRSWNYRWKNYSDGPSLITWILRAVNLSLLRSETSAITENGLERGNLAGLHKRRASSQWMQVASGSQERQGEGFSLSVQKGMQPSDILIIVQGIFIDLENSIIIRETICIFAYMNKNGNVQNIQYCALFPINNML